MTFKEKNIILKCQEKEKCDLWSVGLTLFEIYFGVLPYGNNPNTKKINNIIYDEKKFIYRKSNIHTLDILFKRLLQINPDNRMSTSEFYNYVTNEDFLSQNAIAINDDPKYLVLYQEIINEKQVEYKEEIQPESNNKEAKEQQDINKTKLDKENLNFNSKFVKAVYIFLEAHISKVEIKMGSNDESDDESNSDAEKNIKIISKEITKDLLNIKEDEEIQNIKSQRRKM